MVIHILKSTVALCYLFATVWAATSTTYIVKFRNDAVNKLQKRYNHDEMKTAFYDELQNVLGKDSFTPENSFSAIFQGVTFVSSSPRIVELVESLSMVEKIWIDKVHRIPREESLANRSAQSEKNSEYKEEQLENSLAKRDLISNDVIDEVLELQYIYANQTRYYNQCLPSYIPNPPEPDSNASEKCKNYYNYGWKTKNSCTNPNSNSNSSSIAVNKAHEMFGKLNATGWNPFNSTRVNMLHYYGTTGKNVVIGFLDTGVDKSHPALKDKYMGGYDFVGDNFDGSNSPQPDDDPNDTDGHGTAVVAVAVGKSRIFKSVAYDAKYRMYRVFSSDLATTTSIILSALERAVADNVDIISISAGDPTAWSFTPFAITVNNIIKSGTPVIFSAGNDGQMGPYNANGGSATDAISVGNVQTDKLVTWPSYLISNNSDIPKLAYYVSATAGILDLDGVYDVDYLPKSSCTADNFPPRKNDILLMPFALNAQCSRNAQYDIAKKLGYKYAFYIEEDQFHYVYNSKYTLEPPLLGAATLPYHAGIWLAEQAGSSFQMVFNSSVNLKEYRTYVPGSGFMSPSSSWGPSFDGFFSPDVSAPGGNVFSAGLGGTYVTVSGTSFSCPYIAGVAALYFEEKGYAKSIGKPAVSNVGKTLKSRLVTYANSLKWYSGNKDNGADFAPLIQQGGGMVDAYLTASVGETTVEPSYLVVNSSHDPLQSNFFDITVTNTFDIDAKYTIDSKPHLVVNSFDDGGNSNFFPPPVAVDNARVNFPFNSFTLAPGESKTVQVEIKLDTDPVFKHSIYTGKIIFNSIAGGTVRVPYMAFSENTYKTVPIFTSPVLFGQYSDNQGFVPSTSTSHVFQTSQSQYPFIAFNINYGSIEYSLDLVSSDFTASDLTIEEIYPDSKTKRHLAIGDVSKRDNSSAPISKGYYGPLGFNGNTFPIPLASKMSQFGPVSEFATGQQLSPGSYRILQRAVKPYGDRFNINDWEVDLSDPFTLV